MPKLLCQCGYVHDLSPIPDAGYVVVRCVDYEQLVDAERALAALHNEGGEREGPIIRTINALHSLLYECPKCGRLAWRKEHDEVVFFQREVRDA